MIKYSYIIPHKDSIKLLLRCINSIEDKDNSQIIVIDDNSKNQDEIIAAIGTFPSVELILSKHNIGAGAARNLGLKKQLVNGFYLQMLMIFLMKVIFMQ